MSARLFDLSGRTAVVLGGTSGIGRALALGLAEAGADVVATGRREAEVAAAAAEIEARGRRSLRVAADVTRRPSLERLLAECVKAFGKVDILLNCAGRTKRTPSLEVSEEEWASILETNLTGTFRACQVFGAHMVERGYGRIVNIASLGTFAALLEVTAYCASKAAVASVTKSLAIEWAGRGVCVNAIAPGVFETELTRPVLTGTRRGEEYLMRTPMKRFGRLEELVGAAVFLSAEAASFVTGQIVAVDGGFLASGNNS